VGSTIRTRYGALVDVTDVQLLVVGDLAVFEDAFTAEVIKHQ